MFGPKINWKDNIKPELESARDAVAMKAFENAKFLMEQEKELRCMSGNDHFAIAFGKKFFKGMAFSAKYQFDNLMKDEGYVAVSVFKKSWLSWLFGSEHYTAYVPEEKYNYAMACYPDDHNQAVACMLSLTEMAWYK